ncbi:helix-turn-helix domain-containing protein [Nocardia goodfellowii]|uniref:AraC-like DNA-binding protein n=1 Tax=Nocardia goodfellowii TaxID=882446 RepID=A0ABS4QBM6_9NOCA|nr:helix-turn-helix domain-containing protein [Nocardia goodfellowii]MBP2188499.1 AraC-like DNA-binding protein [Nocardia goodfellowii]
MDAARVLELRGIYQVRAKDVVHSPAALFEGLDVIRCFGFDVTEPETVRRRKIPGGTVKIVFALDGVFGGRAIEPTALVIGMHDRGGRTEHSGRMHSVQVQLGPLAARRLLGVPMGELRNTTADLGALIGRPAGELTDRLAHAVDWTQRFALVAGFVRDRAAAAAPADPAITHAVAALRRIAAAPADPAITHAEAALRRTAAAPADPAITHAVAALRRQRGTAVTALADEIGWSHRYFRRRFTEQVGLPPKDYSSLLRFSHALTVLGSDPSAVAADLGYYDQSHLIRDFHRFAGTTPGRLFAPADTSP